MTRAETIEREAERMFMARYSHSWRRATGEQPYWIAFSDHPQGCSLGIEEMGRWRKMARENLEERGVISEPQGTLGY